MEENERVINNGRTIINDRRTDEQKRTHVILIGGTDRFMSGWGPAEGGASYAFWACTPDDEAQVWKWVEARSDIERVRVVGPDYRPGPSCRHMTIYPVTPGHPALPFSEG